MKAVINTRLDTRPFDNERHAAGDMVCVVMVAIHSKLTLILAMVRTHDNCCVLEHTLFLEYSKDLSNVMKWD